MFPILKIQKNLVVLIFVVLINVNITSAIPDNAQNANGVRIAFKNAEFYFNSSNGGEITEYYDLNVDPNKTKNLVNISIPGTIWGNLWPLFTTGFYNPYNVSALSTGGYSKASVTLKENSSNRLVIFTSSKISNLDGAIIKDIKNNPVLVNTTWTFDKSTGLVFVERTIFMNNDLSIPPGWRWYPFYFTRSSGFKNNATYYMFNTTFSKTVTSGPSTYINKFNKYPLFPPSTNGIFGIAVPFMNSTIEGDGAHNIIIIYNSDDLLKTEWRSDNYNDDKFLVTETGAVHEFPTTFNMSSHTYHAVLDFTHKPIDEQSVTNYAKYADSLFPIFNINISTNKYVYSNETYFLDITGFSYYNISLRPLLTVTYENGSIYSLKDYGVQSYSKNQTFSDKYLDYALSLDQPYNLTLKIQILSLTNAIIAQSDTKISILPPMQLAITTDKPVYYPGDRYWINVSGRVNQNLTNMTPKFTDKNDTGINLIKYYPPQNYTSGDTFIYTVFNGTIPVDAVTGNHTYTIEILTPSNISIAQSSTKMIIARANTIMSILPSMELTITTDKPVYYPGERYWINVSGKVNQNLTNMTPKFTDENDTGINLVKYYPPQNYTTDETFTYTILNGTIPRGEKPGNHTYTIEILTPDNISIAQANTRMSILSPMELTITTDKPVYYPGDLYWINVSGKVDQDLVHMTPKFTDENDTGINLVKYYPPQNYTSGETFIETILNGTIPMNEKPGNHTYTIEILTPDNISIAQANTRMSILSPMELTITTDKPIYYPGDLYWINVSGKVNQNLTNMTPKFTDENNTGINLVKYYPPQNYTSGETFTYTILNGTIPIDTQIGNHTYTIEILTPDNTSLAQANTRMSIFPPMELTITTDKPVYYPGDRYWINVSGKVNQDLVHMTPKFTDENDTGINLVIYYPPQNYTIGETFIETILNGTIPMNEKSGNHTYTIEILTPDNTSIARANTRMSILPPMELIITTDKPVYYPGDLYWINVSGKVNQNLTNMTPKFTDKNDTGINLIKYYPPQKYTSGETFTMTILSGTIPMDEKPGNHTYTIEILTPDNTSIVQSSTGIRILHLDASPPIITYAMALPSVIVADGKASSLLKVVAADESSIASLVVNLSDIGGSAMQAMEYNASSEAWEYKVNTTIIGAFSLPVNATDNSGNFNNTVSIALTSIQPPDTSPPEITIISPQSKTYTTSSVKLDFNVADPSGVDWIGYNLDGSENITIANYTILTGMLNGSHKIILFANDTLGNMGSKSVDFVIDATNLRISLYVDNSTVIAGSNLSGYRIVDNPLDRMLHLKVVHEIRNSSGIVVKMEWERNGTLDAHSSNSYRGYLYVPSWAPADTYTITGSLYDFDSGELYDNASIDFNVNETNITAADDWKIDNW